MASFRGFQPHDFNTTVRGSHWRHRRALGGQLRIRLRRIFGLRYQTWGLPGVNSVHIARRSTYQFPPHHPQPCLFITATPIELRWGVQLPAQGPVWQRFIELLQHPPFLTWCLFALEAYGFILTDLADARGGVWGGCWRYEKGELTWREACIIPRAALPREIPYRLSQNTPSESTLLSLYAVVSQEDAIGWGEDAVEFLAPSLAALIPLYEWWVQAAGLDLG